MSENDRKLLAEIVRCSRGLAGIDQRSEQEKGVAWKAELIRALDRYDLKAEERIA